MKKILIPIDFKFNSYGAVDYAINFFKNELCEFYFINTYTYDIDGLNALSILQDNDDRFEKPKTDSEENLGLLIQSFVSQNKNKKHFFNAISECVDLIAGIKQTIKKIKIDLLIVPKKNTTKNIFEKYSKNTKRIIENIRECPVMIIPSPVKLVKEPKFALISNFKQTLPKTQLENWYKLVKVSKGIFKIVTISSKDKMTPLQKKNQNRVRFQIEMFAQSPITIEYVESIIELKDYIISHPDYIICLVDRKPNFLRICGITNSRITNLGTLQSTPLIAFHY